MGEGCIWPRCDQTGTLLVLAGPRPSDAEHHGPYCVSHAAMACADLRRERPGSYWFDWSARHKGRERSQSDTREAESP